MATLLQILSQSPNEVLKGRAVRIAEQCKMEQETLVNKLKGELMRLEDKQTQMLDLNPDTTISTKIENFDAEKLVKDYQSLSIAIAEKQVEVQIALENLNERFTTVLPKTKK